VLDRVMKMLAPEPGVARKNHGTVFGVDGWPDVEYLEHGMMLYIECKRAGKKPTKKQAHRMRQLSEQGGATCYVVQDLSMAQTALKEWREWRWKQGLP